MVRLGCYTNVIKSNEGEGKCKKKDKHRNLLHNQESISLYHLIQSPNNRKTKKGFKIHFYIR